MKYRITLSQGALSLIFDAPCGQPVTVLGKIFQGRIKLVKEKPDQIEFTFFFDKPFLIKVEKAPDGPEDARAHGG